MNARRADRRGKDTITLGHVYVGSEVQTMSKDQKTQEPVFEEITGLKTAISQLEAFAGHLNEAVANSATSEQTAATMGEELEKQKDNPVIRALLALMPESEQKLKDSVTKSNRTAVNSAVLQIREQQGIISTLTSQLVAKYGSASELQPKGVKKPKGSPFGGSGAPNITDAIKAKLESNPEFVALNPVFTAIPDAPDHYRVQFDGHERGTVYIQSYIRPYL